MTGDRGAELVFLLLALSLPASALIARRLPAGTWLRMALLWLVIILATVALVAIVRQGFDRPSSRDHDQPHASTSIHFT